MLAVAAVLAWHSVAYPLALTAVPPIAFGIFGESPLPEGAVIVALSALTLLSLAGMAHRRETPPAGVVVAAPLVLTFALLCLLVLRQPVAPETDYGAIKTALFLCGNVVFLLGGICAGWSLPSLRLLLLAVLWISVAGAALLVLHVAGGGSASILPAAVTFSEGDHSISMGRQMATGVLVALAFTLSGALASGRLVVAAALPLLAAALIASGSRGPIVALIAGIVVLLALGLGERLARRRLVMVLGVAAVAVAVVQAIVPEASLARAFSFASTDLEGSSSGRTEMWRRAWEIIGSETELGIGTGGYAEIDPFMVYPHNLVLEAAVELGLLGALAVVAFLVAVAWRVLAARRHARRDDRLRLAALLALFTAATVNAMFSFALHTNWEVWLWAGVATGFAGRVLAAHRGSAAPAA